MTDNPLSDHPSPDAPQPKRVPWPETPEIHNRGMGPELRGTRIVMTDIYQHLPGRTHEEVAALFRLTVEQVRAAVAYIDAHRERVEADMAVLRERAARGNSTEVEARLAQNHEKVLAKLRELRARGTPDGEGAGHARAVG